MRTAPNAAALLLARGSGDQPPPRGKPNTAPAHRPIPPGALSPTMVSAVSGAQTGAAHVQLKFELRARPMPAQPLDIDMAILPGPGLDRIYGRVEASEG